MTATQVVKFFASFIGIALVSIGTMLYPQDFIRGLTLAICGGLLIIISLITEMKQMGK